MRFLLAICIFLLFHCVNSNLENSPRIVIIGAGASGIAAASKLYENGFENILILEAQDRIGGRIHTTQFGEYLIDLGAQWIHGQLNNVVYELAAPYGLLENTTWKFSPYSSTGLKIDETIFNDTINIFENALYNITIPDNDISVGEYYEQKFAEYFEKHPEIDIALQNDLLRFYDVLECSFSASDTWYEPSIKAELRYEKCEGNNSINWKQNGYSTILDILMKKFPDPTEELPILNNTIFNSEVINIDYTGDIDFVKIRTLNNQEYLADHVIVTQSLGVLKADYQSLFNPPLPESKITNIKSLAYGTECKIFFQFDEPWWDYNLNWGFSLLFNESYRNALENSISNKKWITSTTSFSSVENKPHLLLAWVTAKGCRLLETLPDDEVLEYSMDMLHTFLGKDYNITKPSAMIRWSTWTQNKHFRGTYSFHSIESEIVHASAEGLSQPIIKNQLPIILFAGEATSKSYYSTVHGAIVSGWREADRLIKLYGKTS